MPSGLVYVYILLAVSGIAGVVIGSVLQYRFALRAEARRTAQSHRTEAYADLIKAIAGLTKNAADPAGEAARPFGALYAEARARVIIYGSPSVVTRLAAFSRSGVEFQSPAAGEALASVVKAMRADGLGTREPIADRDIRQVLFGRD